MTHDNQLKCVHIYELKPDSNLKNYPMHHHVERAMSHSEDRVDYLNFFYYNYL